MAGGGRPIDISVAVAPGMVLWPGDPPTEVAPVTRLARGDEANVSRLALGTHSGTHCDPPRHFDDAGRAVDRLDLAALVGPAWVADLTHVARDIGAADLDAAGVPAGTVRLLLKTRNSRHWARGDAAFDPDFVGVAADGARWLLARGVRLVGIDYLSIERFDAPPDFPTHRLLLAAGVVIVETLDLSAVASGPYTFAFLPLKVAGGDGAPGRAILLPPGAFTES